MADPGPVPGPYNDFFLPILKDKRIGWAPGTNAPAWDKWERAYMKEAIGLFLGLPVARNRVGQYKDDAKNNLGGRYFNYRKQRGSRSYTLILKPNSTIKAFSTDTRPGKQYGKVEVLKNSISFCVPRTVKVSEMMGWLANPARIGDLNGDLGEAVTLAGDPQAVGYSAIIALISPDDRRHPLRVVTDDKQSVVTSDLGPITEIEGEVIATSNP